MQGCERALLHAKPGQRVSCVPGMEAVTEKRQLAATMVAAYGEGAFAVIPRTYLLPEEYWRWRLAIQSQVLAANLSRHSAVCRVHPASALAH